MSEIQVHSRLKSNYDSYYDDGIAEWRRLSAIGKAANILKLCQGVPHETVLEIGAGNGAVLETLADRKFAREYRALDISTSGIEQIRAKAIPGLVEAGVFDGYRTPYADHQFDLVILSHVVEHLEHPRLLLYEAARVGRHVFVEVPLEDTLRLPEDFVFDSVGHINAYSRQTIRRLLQSCHFRIKGELVVNFSREAHRLQKGNKGVAQYYIKEGLLRICPRLATRLFLYHAAFLCETASASPPLKVS